MSNDDKWLHITKIIGMLCATAVLLMAIYKGAIGSGFFAAILFLVIVVVFL